jgi:hypothetical protein
MTKLTAEQLEAAREEADDLRAVMDTPAGRRFIWRLLGRCGTFQSGWTPSKSTNTASTPTRRWSVKRARRH